jgi:Oxysterol-binding protein
MPTENIDILEVAVLEKNPIKRLAFVGLYLAV